MGTHSFRFHVRSDEAGMKIPAFLVTKKQLKLPSAKKARDLLEKGCCSINGEVKTFASYVVCVGDIVDIVLRSDQNDSFSPSILYEDQYLFIIDKPPGIVSDQKSIEAFMKRPCFLAHRLDKDTSGILICASSKPYEKDLQDLFLHKAVEKTYVAIVDGKMNKKEGRIEKKIVYKGRVGSSIFYEASELQGMSASTTFKTVQKNDMASEVLLYPHTGRTHQLRVHMASLYHPILGDYHYGKRFVSSKRPKRHLLHAIKVVFLHPFEKKKVVCIAPIPDDFYQHEMAIFGSSMRGKEV